MILSLYNVWSRMKRNVTLHIHSDTILSMASPAIQIAHGNQQLGIETTTVNLGFWEPFDRIGPSKPRLRMMKLNGPSMSFSFWRRKLGNGPLWRALALGRDPVCCVSSIIVRDLKERYDYLWQHRPTRSKRLIFVQVPERTPLPHVSKNMLRISHYCLGTPILTNPSSVQDCKTCTQNHSPLEPKKKNLPVLL